VSAALDRTLIALADPSRRKVIDLLRKKPRRAGEMSDALSISAPAMSRHLRVLRKSGLVLEEIDEGDGRVRVYRLRREPFTRLQDWLAEVDAFWSDQLAAFKEHLDRG
jgi:DNA-binding transcriptional ArsR family regulator